MPASAALRSDRARFFALRHRLFRCSDRDWNGTAYNRALAGPVLPEGGTPGRATTVSSALDEPAPFAVADFLPPSPLRSPKIPREFHPLLVVPDVRTTDGLAVACVPRTVVARRRIRLRSLTDSS